MSTPAGSIKDPGEKATEEEEELPDLSANKATKINIQRAVLE
ncbi:hypothetical protein A2U01_0004776, partial [Trifolium medium]|nr:hypothetical protein [Trifolium medium]